MVSVLDMRSDEKFKWKLYYSPGVSHHGEKTRNLLLLEHYVPAIHFNEPVWFFGLYFFHDYLILQAHRGRKIINWRGSDALQLQNDAWKIKIIQRVNAIHVCQSERQQKILANIGMGSVVRPTLNTSAEKIKLEPFPVHSTEILVFWRKGIDHFINAELFFEVARECPEVLFHVIGDENPNRFSNPEMKNIIFHGFVSEEEVDVLMNQCKGTMRPWESDGTPNIQTKMLLKGRYAAHKCKFEKVSQCIGVKDYVFWIKKLENIRIPNLAARRWWLAHVNNFDFLEGNFKIHQ
jgi:hypothetical protein